MIVPPSVQQKHRVVSPYLKIVADHVRDTVLAFCDQKSFAYVGRSKSIESLAEKIDTGRFERWDQIDDLFACCVIVPSLGDEPEVLAYLREQFQEVECRSRGATKKDPAVFRFDATRFIGRLNSSIAASASPDVLAVTFEVQIRTAFEHAWSVTTHALTYKSREVNWRHLRLAAQLRAAVEQLDQLVVGFEATASLIPDQDWPEVIARREICAVFSELQKSDRLPPEVVPSSWGRFSENLLSLIRSSSKGYPKDMPAYVSKALRLIEAEVVAATPLTFPRSLSLMQFCVGALARGGLFSEAPKNFYALVSRELLDLYPEAKLLGPGFDVQSN